MKRIVIAIFALGFMMSAWQSAKADDVTFSMTCIQCYKAVTVDASGINVNVNGTMTATDNDNGKTFILPGITFNLATGPASSFNTIAGPMLDADFNYGPSGLPGVEVFSSACATGTGSMGNVCLLGVNNGNHYTANSRTGSFQGLFTLQYVDPIILAALSATGPLSPFASDTFNTSTNRFTTSGGNITSDTADMTQGGITISTVPEPSSMSLFGIGLLGLVGLTFWQVKSVAL